MDIIQALLIFSVVTLAVLVFILLRLIRKIESQFQEMKGLKLDDMHLEDKIEEEVQKLQIETQNIQNDILKRVTDLENEIADFGDFVEGKISEIKKANSSAGNLGEYNKEREERRDEAKDRIIELFESADSLVNDDIEKELGVADSTVTKYLNELEAEGKIEQIGESGRFVEYRRK